MDAPLDLDDLLASVGGDRQLLDELAAAFAPEVPRWIRRAPGRAPPRRHGDHPSGRPRSEWLGRLLPGVRQRAVDVEAMGRDNRLDGAAAAIDRLEADLLKLSRLLGQAPWRR